MHSIVMPFFSKKNLFLLINVRFWSFSFLHLLFLQAVGQKVESSVVKVYNLAVCLLVIRTFFTPNLVCGIRQKTRLAVAAMTRTPVAEKVEPCAACGTQQDIAFG